ncbi:hypothetical protein CDAR_168851 [Caerostris darwini]|uniref:Uncharacterized protein n=1 Tax=Caerostris darwini TaxID=1538125 RepID=A0AAV4WNY5_9ARAC|nr:hypothetical protein CDAR_168851 [Caerostris darwini]
MLPILPSKGAVTHSSRVPPPNFHPRFAPRSFICGRPNSPITLWDGGCNDPPPYTILQSTIKKNIPHPSKTDLAESFFIRWCAITTPNMALWYLFPRCPKFGKSAPRQKEEAAATSKAMRKKPTFFISPKEGSRCNSISGAVPFSGGVVFKQIGRVDGSKQGTRMRNR